MSEPSEVIDYSRTRASVFVCVSILLFSLRLIRVWIASGLSWIYCFTLHPCALSTSCSPRIMKWIRRCLQIVYVLRQSWYSYYTSLAYCAFVAVNKMDSNPPGGGAKSGIDIFLNMIKLTLIQCLRCLIMVFF